MTLSLFFFVFLSAEILAETSTPSVFTCKNGEISDIPCKKQLFGIIKSCENKTLTCEGGSFCCPKPPPPTKKSKTTTTINPLQSSIPPTDLSISTSTFIPTPENCKKCDLAARHSCFLSLHLDSNSTGEDRNPDCIVCDNCCEDAFPHKCEVWRNHDFCDMKWYSDDKKRILCGRTCGICA